MLGPLERDAGLQRLLFIATTCHMRSITWSSGREHLIHHRIVHTVSDRNHITAEVHIGQLIGRVDHRVPAVPGPGRGARRSRLQAARRGSTDSWCGAAAKLHHPTGYYLTRFRGCSS